MNGSVSQIAGVCNSDGNVVGMMPHPERAAEKEINQFDNKPSSLIFQSLVETLGVKNWVFKNMKNYTWKKVLSEIWLKPNCKY